MTKVSICAFSAALMLAACTDSKKADIERNDTPSTEPASSKPEPASVAKKESKPATSSAAPESPAEKFTESTTPAPTAAQRPGKVAVSGTVWSAERISVTTDDGIFSVPAGKQLRVVKHTEVGYLVSDGKSAFEVTEAQVSISSTAGNNTLQTEAAQRTAGVEWHKAQLAAVQQQKERAAVVEQAAAADRKRRELETRLDALVREEAALKVSLRQVDEQESQAAYSRAIGRTYTKSINPQQRTAWTVRLASVRLELDRVRMALDRTQQ